MDYAYSSGSKGHYYKPVIDGDDAADRRDRRVKRQNLHARSNIRSRSGKRTMFPKGGHLEGSSYLEGERECSGCGKVKQLKQFRNHAIEPRLRKGDGYNIHCRSCNIAKYTREGYKVDGFVIPDDDDGSSDDDDDDGSSDDDDGDVIIIDDTDDDTVVCESPASTLTRSYAMYFDHDVALAGAKRPRGETYMPYARQKRRLDVVVDVHDDAYTRRLIVLRHRITSEWTLEFEIRWSDSISCRWVPVSELIKEGSMEPALTEYLISHLT